MFLSWVSSPLVTSWITALARCYRLIALPQRESLTHRRQALNVQVADAATAMTYRVAIPGLSSLSLAHDHESPVSTRATAHEVVKASYQLTNDSLDLFCNPKVCITPHLPPGSQAVTPATQVKVTSVLNLNVVSLSRHSTNTASRSPALTQPTLWSSISPSPSPANISISQKNKSHRVAQHPIPFHWTPGGVLN